AIRKPSAQGPAPLEDLTGRVKNLIAIGGSQSGARLFTYINAVHPTVGLFDGFAPSVSTGGSALSQDPLPAVAPPAGAARVIRADTTARVLWVNSESEFIAGARGIHQQPDGPGFRLWEVAGVAHGTAPTYRVISAKLTRMGVSMGAAAPASGASTATPNIPVPPQNDVDNTPITRIAVASVKKWIETGRPPASVARAELTIPTDPAKPAAIVRDRATGLALGGLRLPDIAVPTRTVWGERMASAPQANALTGGTDQWNGDKDPWDGSETDVSPTPEPSL